VNPVHVTDVTPLIAGVMARQVHDPVYEDDDCDGGQDFLSEDTLDWLARDMDDNIWYFREHTKESCNREQPDMVCSTEVSVVAISCRLNRSTQHTR